MWMICVQTLEITLHVLDLSVVLQLFRAFGLFLSCQILHTEGAWYSRWSLQFFWWLQPLPEKKRTYTGFTNNDTTLTKTITFGIKDGPCEKLPIFSFSSPFPHPFLSFSFPFLYSSFSFFFTCPFVFFSFPVPFLLVFFSFPFPFLFVFFSFPVPFLFVFFSFPFPFRVLFLSCSFFISCSFPFLSFFLPFLYSSFSSLMWILWSRCEASAWENDKREKQITCGNTI